MSGHLGDLSSDQLQALNELKAHVGTEYPTDEATLLRFLRARSFKVEAAKKQYINQCKWRKENDVDNILNQPPPLDKEMMAIISLGYHKHDRDGRPVYVELTGKIDANKLMELPLSEIMKRHIWHNEKQLRRAEELSKQFGKNIETTTQIHDMTGLNFSHRKCLSIFKHVSKIDQDVYPERVGRVIFVNVPWLFPLLWKIASPLLDPNTREKFVVLGGNEIHKLLDYVEPENLPEIFGGVCKCPGGCMHIVPGHLDSKSADSHGLIQTNIKAGKSLLQEIHCTKGETVYWHYIAASTDIKFRVLWQPEKASQPESIIPLEHVTLESAEGHFAATANGKLIIEFDNSTSTWLSKGIKYRINVDHGS
ncbi:Sec14 cytosolic factor [Trichoplax sp. H2]|nr:Sec14 cytosolic factor [Trichoplax sp. H2]|eukprot:RDD38308.1 Sec14 cytosolic factor [Trichoplax sp. H2]